MLAQNKSTKDKKKNHGFGLQEFCLVLWKSIIRSWYIFWIIQIELYMLSFLYGVHDSFLIQID